MGVMMKPLSHLGIFAGTLLSAQLMLSPAQSGQDTAPMDVQATVVAACTLVNTPANINFGDLIGDGSSYQTPLFDVVINCPLDHAFEIGFDGGLNFTDPNLMMVVQGGDPTLPDDRIGYNFFGDDGIGVGDSGGTLINNNTNFTGPPRAGTGTGADQTVQFFASTVPVAPANVQGLYTDQVQIIFAY